MLKDFKDFLTQGNIIEIAVAVIMANSFTQVVNSLVNDVIMPLIAFRGYNSDFLALKFGPVSIGNFFSSILNFLFIAFFVYFIIILPLKKVSIYNQSKAKKI